MSDCSGRLLGGKIRIDWWVVRAQKNTYSANRLRNLMDARLNLRNLILLANARSGGLVCFPDCVPSDLGLGYLNISHPNAAWGVKKMLAEVFLVLTTQIGLGNF